MPLLRWSQSTMLPASLIDDNAVMAEIAGEEFTVNYAMLY